MTKQTLQLV